MGMVVMVMVMVLMAMMVMVMVLAMMMMVIMMVMVMVLMVIVLMTVSTTRHLDSWAILFVGAIIATIISSCLVHGARTVGLNICVSCNPFFIIIAFNCILVNPEVTSL